MSKSEGDEVALQIVVTSNRPVFRDHQQLFILGPSQSPNRTFVPLPNCKLEMP
jgi:hypothetical protein